MMRKNENCNNGMLACKKEYEYKLRAWFIAFLRGKYNKMKAVSLNFESALKSVFPRIHPVG